MGKNIKINKEKENVSKIMNFTANSFFNNIETLCFIYLLNNDNNKLYYSDNKNIVFNLEFYDIYPIKKDIFEEFSSSVPNKIDNVLKKCNINLNFINFSSKKNIVKNLLDKNKNISITIIYILFLINF